MGDDKASVGGTTGGFHQWTLTIVGIVTAVAAVIGVYAATRGGGTPPPTTVVTDTSMPTTTLTAPPGGGQTACSPTQLKGSANDFGERIFNEPSTPRYAEIVPIACFDSRPAAEAAGYRSYEDCPASATVKGNVDPEAGAGAKGFYYLPTTPGYGYVNPEQCFPSAAAAGTAGYVAKP